ncbi:hypothetical protein ASPCAL11359 [Aspergillus calidoustus]|uniref:Clr5 domain-containing protein n=1 Tax=Aspergillus calidoustus TaxID=454130 RepID=A0A0U5G913_ASPCI|nr:hypothetical protein ASPCAL11359 [Aspergillus calidoustus]
MDDPTWEAHKLELQQLYLQQNRSLSQVIHHMASTYDFRRSKAQYENRLYQWGWQKYQRLTPSDGNFIGRRTHKRRKVFNKASEVYIDREEYAPRKLKKALCAKAMWLIRPGAGWAISSFPGYARKNPRLHPSIRGNAPYLERIPPVAALHKPSATGASRGSFIGKRVTSHLTSIVPWRRLSHPPVRTSTSRTAAALTILMPEEYEDHHQALAERFSEGRQSALDSLAVDMFLLSNNLVSHEAKGKTFASMEIHDARVVDLLRASGWDSVAQIRILLSTQEPTAGAIAEQAFASALRILDRDIVKMMLEAGVDPNVPIDTVASGPQTPLQYLASIGTQDHPALDLIELLLSYRADIDLSVGEISPLEHAVEQDHTKVIEFLVGRGPRITPSCLAAAAGKVADADLFSTFLGPATDMDVRSGWPLSEAVRSGRIHIASLLLSNGADVNALVGINFDGSWGLTTAIGVAVEANGVEMLKFLLDACSDINPELDGLRYISPLALAVDREKTEPLIIDLLLLAGINVHVADCCGEMTLVERALESNDIAACEVLIQHGARIEKPLSEGTQYTSALGSAIKSGAAEICAMLIRMGARLNDAYTEPPGTVLGAAIEKGDVHLIRTLVNAGAVALTDRLQTIGNIDTAMYLQQLGILEGILRVSGTRILVAAISAGNNALVHWLLYQNASIDFLQTHTAASSNHGNETTPLQAAISSGRLSFVHAILDTRVQVTDRDLTTAVHTSGVGCTDDLWQLMLKHLRGKAPTTIAAGIMGRKPELVQLLLKGGADPTGKPLEILDYWKRDGCNDIPLGAPRSVLELLPRWGNQSLLECLLQSYDGDPTAVSRALTLSIILNRSDFAECLMNANIDVNHEIIICHFEGEDDGAGDAPMLVHNEVFTPLQPAAKYQQLPIAKKLLEHPEIDLNYLGDGLRRRTALQHAVDKANMDLVNLLLRDHDADVNIGPASNGGATALQLAAIRGYLGIARRLVDLHAEVDAPPAEFNGRSALEGAAENGRIDILQMLLDAGASVTGVIGERQYRRAVYLAKQNGHYAAARLLRQFKERME